MGSRKTKKKTAKKRRRGAEAPRVPRPSLTGRWTPRHFILYSSARTFCYFLLFFFHSEHVFCLKLKEKTINVISQRTKLSMEWEQSPRGGGGVLQMQWEWERQAALRQTESSRQTGRQTDRQTHARAHTHTPSFRLTV